MRARFGIDKPGMRIMRVRFFLVKVVLDIFSGYNVNDRVPFSFVQDLSRFGAY